MLLPPKYRSFLKSIKLQAASCFALATALQAQGQMSATDADPSVYETITVTAERVEQTAQEVAASLSVVTKDDLIKSAVQSLQDIDQIVPNMVLSDQGSPRFAINSIRGIGDTVRDDYFSNTIGIYLDGVPLTAAEFSRSIGDAERLEILRGPQGTLYGRNTPAGVINIVSRAPEDDLCLDLSAAAGNFDLFGSSARLTGALVPGILSGKVFLDYQSRDGFTDYATDTFGSIDDLEAFTASSTLRFTPDQQTVATLTVSTEQVDQGAYPFQPYADFRLREVDIAPPNREDRDMQNVALNLTRTFGALEVQSITGYRTYEVISNQDLGYNPLITMFGGGTTSSLENGEQFTQELRLSSPANVGAFRWLAGLFYSTDTLDYDYTFNIPAFGGATTLETEYERQELSGYGEATWQVFEALHLTAGIRVTEDKHELSNNLGPDADDTYSIATPKLRAAWRFSPDKQIYILAMRGSRSGGFNRLTSGDAFDPEYLWNYEIGLKSQWLNDKLLVNAALFQIDWTDQQIRTLVSPGVSEISNAGASENIGGELEFQWSLAGGLELRGFVGFNDAEYTEFISADGVDLSGNSLVSTPDYTAGLSAQVYIPTPSTSFDLWIRPELSVVGEQFVDPENRLEQAAYELVNLNAGLEFEQFSVSAFAKNLFDKDYIAYGYTDGISRFDLAVAGAPQTFGVRFDASF